MLRIDFSAILTAFENHNNNITHYLDLKTGDIVFIADENYIEDVDNDAMYQIKENPDSFIKIELISAHDGFKIMENFTAGIDDKDIKDILGRELYRPKPFKSFKAVLSRYDSLHQEFSEYKKTQMKEIIKNWLVVNNIDAELV